MRQHAAGFETRYWKSAKEYWHMFWNNVVLLSVWGLMCWACGPVLFFSIYILSVSIAGGAGIVLFTVQHNFEHAYASDNQHWNYDAGAINGTSFLILPRFLPIFRTIAWSSVTTSINICFRMSRGSNCLKCTTR
jgi:omega-6 fatty acid desaturase (delta-12 desaturase)